MYHTYQASTEVQPASDIRLHPYKPHRRRSVYTTIRENSVIDSFEQRKAENKEEKSNEENAEEKDENNNDSKSLGNYENENEEEEQEQDKDDDKDENEEALTWIDAESFGSVFTHHGSNLFLRLGALVFGLGNMVNYALEIQANLITNVECSRNIGFKWIFIWMFVFVSLQTFFLFKHSKIRVTKHQPLVWMGMVHLILTNINLWIHTLAREIVEEYKHQIPNLHHHHNASESEHRRCDSNLLHAASPYLIPFVLEYSMIAVGIISSFLYFGGIDSTSAATKANRNLIKVFSLSQDVLNRFSSGLEDNEKPQANENNSNSNTKVRFGPMANIMNSESEKANNILIEKEKAEVSKATTTHHHQHHESQHELNSLQKSHAGLFAGMVLLCITVVTCVIFLFSQLQHNRARAEIIYFSTDIIVHAFLMIACISACIKTKNLGFAPKPVSTDDILLLLAAFGSLTFELTNASALFTALRTPTDPHAEDHLVTSPFPLALNASITTWDPMGQDLDPSHLTRDHLQLASASLAMAQTAVQTLLIFISLRRYPVTIYEATEMPGRGTMAFLIVGNLSVWIFRTILCKSLQLPVQISFFGHVGCLLLTDIHLPLLLFFRFHSSVCFADVWECAYQLLTKYPGND